MVLRNPGQFAIPLLPNRIARQPKRRMSQKNQLSRCRLQKHGRSSGPLILAGRWAKCWIGWIGTPSGENFVGPQQTRAIRRLPMSITKGAAPDQEKRTPDSSTTTSGESPLPCVVSVCLVEGAVKSMAGMYYKGATTKGNSRTPFRLPNTATCSTGHSWRQRFMLMPIICR